MIFSRHNNFMKRIFCLLFIFIIGLCVQIVPQKSFADTSSSGNIYIIYNANGDEIFESDFVEIGDKIITKDLEEYEVVRIDDNKHIGYCEYNGRYIMPNVVEDKKKVNLATKKQKHLGLYMTHNDESYVPTDGTESVYGAGGIHDVAKRLKREFESLSYNCYLDETLHIPHDSSAYTRSATTAKNLLTKDLDGIFDIHRDGASRSLYVTNVDGVERCKIRIVVGQKNPNFETNLQFAMYLLTISKEYCPWLFLDIYYAKGHYNQALSNKALLFEMGSHLVEKELVLASCKELAQIVDKTLFGTAEQDEKTLLVSENIPSDDKSLINNILDDTSSVSLNFESTYKNNVINFVCLFLFFSGIVSVLAYSRHIYIKKGPENL